MLKTGISVPGVLSKTPSLLILQKHFYVRACEEGVNPCKPIIDAIKKKCNTAVCPEIFRIDENHYKPSDKEKRNYQQTWCEPPEFVRKKKKICPEPVKFEAIDQERRSRRASKQKGNSCQMPKELKVTHKMELGLMSCIQTAERGGKCPKMDPPNCKAGRNPPTCQVTKLFTYCKKCAPYPSFSECRKDPLPVIPVTECNINQVSMCEAYREFLKKAGITPTRPPVGCPSKNTK